VQHAEADEAAREHQPRAQADQQRTRRHLHPALPEPRPALPLLERDRLADAGAEHEQADDDGALARPERVGVEVLLDPTDMVQVEAEMEQRHPHDGQAAQRIEAVETV
jgi:hypothetical protein